MNSTPEAGTPAMQLRPRSPSVRLRGWPGREPCALVVALAAAPGQPKVGILIAITPGHDQRTTCKRTGLRLRGTTPFRSPRPRVSRAATVDPAGWVRRCARRHDEPTTRGLPHGVYSFSFAGAFFAGGFLPWALTTLGLSIFFAPAGSAAASNGKIGPSSRVLSKICLT